MKACFICLAIGIAVPVFAQDNGAQHIKKGNDLFKKGALPEAIAEYNKAATGANKYVALVNKGDALFRLKKYDEALKSYQQANEAGNTDANLRSGAFYNAGVVYSNQNKLNESIEAYKNALRLNSNDVNARENLQKALLEKRNKAAAVAAAEKIKMISRSSKSPN